MTERVNFTMDTERRKEVKELAEIFGVSESAMLNVMVGKYLNDMNKELNK